MTRKHARERRTPFVILGMLLRGPASGYALRQRIEESVGNFWQESFGQLYPALEALAAGGLVEPAAAARDGRDTRVWRITAAGRAALADWLARPPTPQPERNELLLKLFFAELAPAAVRRHLEDARAAAAADLARLTALRAEIAARAAGHAALPWWLATIDYGIAGQDALVRWCDRTAALAPAPPRGRRARRPRGSGRRTPRGSRPRRPLRAPRRRRSRGG